VVCQEAVIALTWTTGIAALPSDWFVFLYWLSLGALLLALLSGLEPARVEPAVDSPEPA
jgi:hypothetical protein